MVAGILLLGLAIFGLCWLFGFGKPERLVKFVVWLTFGPILLGVFFGEWSSFYSGLPWYAQVMFLTALPFAILFGFRLFFPQSTLIRGTIDFAWSFLVFWVTFPIRLIWRSGRHVSERERNRTRLQRYRPAVGGRPPLRNDPEGRLNQRRQLHGTNRN
jgi:hypothetical protein